jgi:hypothetical protein
VRASFSERPVQWLAGFAIAMILLFIAGLFSLKPGLIWDTVVSVANLPSVGTRSIVQAVGPRAEDVPVELPFAIADIHQLRVEADGELTLSTRTADPHGPQHLYYVTPQKPLLWSRAGGRTNPLDRSMTIWTASNTGDRPATISLEATSGVSQPEAAAVPFAATVFVLVVGLYYVQRLVAPKASAIAAASAQETMSQWLFWLVALAGVLLLKPILLPIPSLMHIPYGTFGEDVKMLKETGLTVVMVLSTMIAVWAASTSVAEEIEGRTAITLLSKPISRWQFLLGKFLGIVWPVAVLTLVLGTLLLLTVSTKTVYDMRDLATTEEVTWQFCFRETMSTGPGILLGFFESILLASVSLALSTRLPMLANIVASASIYALGHLAPLMAQSAQDQFPVVAFVAQLVTTVLPVLDHFRVPGAVVGTSEVPAAYLGWAAAYTALYGGIALLAALALFEDRDLA